MYVFNIPHHFRIGDKYQITRLTNLFSALISHPLADPGGGAHPAPPPNDRGAMICYAQNAIFLIFSSLAITFKLNFNRSMAKTR